MPQTYQKKAQSALMKEILPAVRHAIEDLAEEIYSDTLKQHRSAHAPEIRVGALDLATRTVLDELARYLMRDQEINAAIQRWDEFT